MAEFWYDPEVGEGGGYWPLNKIVKDLVDIAAIVIPIFVVVAIIGVLVFLFKYFCLERKHLNAKLRQEIDQGLITGLVLYIIGTGLTVLYLWWKK